MAIVKRETDLAVSDMKGALAIANDCAKLIREKDLSVKISGRDFVKAEGWQFAGTQLGLIPMASKPNRLDREDEICYECEAELINVHTGAVVGRGYAICSNLEKSKKTFDEYAIASMAQTRAISKAYRNLIAWIMKANGFEPTPAEEMEDVYVEPKPIPKRDEPMTKPPVTIPKQPLTDKIDIMKDTVAKGKFAGKKWIELPSQYLNSLRDEKYWSTLSLAVQNAVLDTIEYKSKEKLKSEITNDVQAPPPPIEKPLPVEENVVFDEKGELVVGKVVDKPAPKEEVKTSKKTSGYPITPQDKQIASIVKEWSMPALKDDSEKATQDQIDFLTLLMTSKLFTDTERQTIGLSLKAWGYNTASLQTRVYVTQFKLRFKKAYGIDFDAI